MRILLDSNVWLAILTTDGQCRRLWRQTRGVSEICASAAILDEIEEKLRLKFGFHPRHARLLTLFVRREIARWPVEIRIVAGDLGSQPLGGRLEARQVVRRRPIRAACRAGEIERRQRGAPDSRDQQQA